jgi:uncharacterized RDD family membrane protein YckC
MPPELSSAERLWYYATEDQSLGPERESDLCQRFLAGNLAMSTLVWCQGMDAWLPADVVEPFASAIPELEAEEVADEYADAWQEGDGSRIGQASAPPRAKLWPSRPEPVRRYLARQLDMLIATYIFFLINGAIQEDDMVAFSTHLLWIIPPWAIIEALFLHFWGYTPGKWIMRIEVTDEWGQRMNLQQSLRRSVDVAVRGMGLGIPVLYVFTQVHSLLRLTSNGITPWDEHKRVVVTHQPLEIWRWLAFLAVLLYLVSLLSPMLPELNPGT